MKKLYRKGTVHPSAPLTSDHLSFLPAAILTLAVALSPEDKEVLAYLISCSSSSSFGNHHRRSSSNSNSNGNSNSSINSSTTVAAASSSSARRSTDHPASFNCYCFGCYMSYWVRWDSSPNQQLIHEIIDAFEDGPSVQNKKEKSKKKDRRKNKGSSGSVKSHGGQLMNSSELATPDEELAESENSARDVISREADGGEVGGDGVMEDEEVGKGTSMRRFVGFLGEKIWGIWG